jgi:hypothetical protein
VKNAPNGSFFLLHACACNPTGVGPTEKQIGYSMLREVVMPASLKVLHELVSNAEILIVDFGEEVNSVERVRFWIATRSFGTTTYWKMGLFACELV